jgi:hypothetical protein
MLISDAFLRVTLTYTTSPYKHKMNTCYTCLVIALLLLYLNPSLAYRVHPSSYSYKQYQKDVPSIKMMRVVSTDGDIVWLQDVLVPVNQIPDGKH